MATGALANLVEADWGDTELLLVDLPPGTGDVQLSLIQRSRPAGAVIVSTPQDLSLIDARRAIDLFNKTSVPVLGIIENMATYACPHCGEAVAPVRQRRRRSRGGGNGRAVPRPAAAVAQHPRSVRCGNSAGRSDGPEAEAFAAIARETARDAGNTGSLSRYRTMPLTRDEDIAELLTNARTIAMVGASDRPDRASYGVMKFLQDWGYRVLPVNPQITGEHVHGEFVWRELAQIGVPIDIVDIFRRPEAAAEAVEQAIFVGAKAVWMQIGVINEEAAARAEAAGLRW